VRQRGGEDKSQRGAAGDGGDGRLEMSLGGVDEIFFFNLSRRELRKDWPLQNVNVVVL
jgi:hypothetical protein